MTFAHPISIVHILLATGISSVPPSSSPNMDSSPSMPTTITINAGVVIAHGYELPPPFAMSIENDTLWIDDGAGHRFATRGFPDPATGPAVESWSDSSGDADSGAGVLVTHPTGAGKSTPAHQETPPVHQETPLSVQMAQVAHLLSAGGMLAFGHTYALVFPPNRAETALPELRWVAAHVARLAPMLPLDHPLFRDLAYPSLPTPAASD